LRVGAFGGGWGRVGNLRAGLARIRAADKPIHCHFESADNLSYALLASSCDRLTMTPAGDLFLVGTSAHVFHAKDLLEHLGVRAELLQEGRFKGGADMFTTSELGEDLKSSLDLLLDDLQRSLLDAVASGRG